MFLVAVSIIIVVGVLWFVLLQHRKGDFSFRIKKLQKRTAKLVSDCLKLKGESEFLALYEDTPKSKVVEKLLDQLDQANQAAIEVTDALADLKRRARSWFDFSDLYVDIGIQEEQLEGAEKMYQAAFQLFTKVEADEKKV